MLSRISFISLALGSGIFVLTFLVFWLPFYLTGSAGQLFLYPLLILILPAIGIACIVSIVCASIALARTPQRGNSSPRSLATTIVLAALVLLFAGPAIWFGSLLAALWGGDVTFW